MASKKKRIFNALFMLFCFALTLYYVFAGQDLNKIHGYMQGANSTYWILGVVLVLVYILSESVIIHYLLKNLDVKSRFVNCMLYSFVGFFFSCITPSATGGQPAQAVFMKKENIPVHKSSVVLMMVTISYKIALMVFAFFVFVFRPKIVMHYLQPIMFWVYIGLVLNIVAVLFMLLMAIRPKIAKSIVTVIFRLITKIVKSEKLDTYHDKLDHSMDNFVINSEYIITHKPAVMVSLGVTFIQRTALFLITIVVCYSFGVAKLSAFDVTLIQSMISNAADMLPLPGGMAITEHLFYEAFSPAFGMDLTLPILIVSRGISYYTQLLISAFFTLLVYIKYSWFNVWKG